MNGSFFVVWTGGVSLFCGYVVLFAPDVSLFRGNVVLGLVMLFPIGFWHAKNLPPSSLNFLSVINGQVLL